MNNDLAVTNSATPATPATAVVRGAKKRVSMMGLLDWAYRAECVYELAGAFGDGPVDWPGMGRGNAAAVMAAGMMGGRVDGGPAVWAMPDRVADDALAVHGAVVGLGGARAGVVILHARAGTVPVLDGGPVVGLERIWKDKGDGRWDHVEEYNGSAGIGNRAWLCRLRKVDRAGAIGDSREAWREWRGAVAMLAGHFRSAPQELKRWAVTAALPLAEPWADPAPQDVVRGLDTGETP